MKFIFALICMFALVMAVVFAMPAVNDESIVAVPSDDAVVMADNVHNPEDKQNFIFIIKKFFLHG